MRRLLSLGILVLIACDSIDRESTPRYYVAPPDDDAGAQGDGGSRQLPPDVTVRDGAADGEGGALSFDPATLALSGWWRASFAATWPGVASTGTSATRNLAETTNPPTAAAAVNTFVPADFDGTNDILTNPTPLSGLLSASAWSAAALVYVDAVSTAPTAIQLELLSDTSGYWNLGTWNNPTPKVVVGQFDGATKSAEAPITLAAWNLVQTRFDGTKVEIRVNNGAWVAAPANNIQVTTGTLNVGKNYQNGLFFNGQLLELMLAPTALANAAFDGIRAYCIDRYKLTL